MSESEHQHFSRPMNYNPEQPGLIESLVEGLVVNFTAVVSEAFKRIDELLDYDKFLDHVFAIYVGVNETVRDIKKVLA